MLSVIPLGGYVKLIGDDPRGADGDHPRAFSISPISHRDGGGWPAGELCVGGGNL